MSFFPTVRQILGAIALGDDEHLGFKFTNHTMKHVSRVEMYGQTYKVVVTRDVRTQQKAQVSEEEVQQSMGSQGSAGEAPS